MVPPVELKWHERLNVLNVSLLLFLLAVISSVGVLRGSGRDLDYAANVRRFLANFFPPDFSVTGQTLIGLWETFEIAVMATAFAIVISVPIAMAGAQTLSPRWLVFIARQIMNGIRTIPSLIWALLAVAIVGANPLAGVIGLTFYSVGYLGKFFSDAFESVDIDVARALRASGRAHDSGVSIRAVAARQTVGLELLALDARIQHPLGIDCRHCRRRRRRSAIAHLPGILSVG